jgi:hypothetical protein
MVTRNPAKTVRWFAEVGSSEPGKIADLVVITTPAHGLPDNVYRRLIDATERDVRLVLIDGEPVAGDAALLAALKPGDCEVLATPAGWAPKAVDVTRAGVPKGDQTFGGIEAELQQGLAALGGDDGVIGSGPTAPGSPYSYLKARLLGTGGRSDAAFYQLVLLPNFGLTRDGRLNLAAIELTPLFSQADDFLLHILAGNLDPASGLIAGSTPPFGLYLANLNHITPQGNPFADLVNDWFGLDLPAGRQRCLFAHPQPDGTLDWRLAASPDQANAPCADELAPLVW